MEEGGERDEAGGGHRAAPCCACELGQVQGQVGAWCLVRVGGGEEGEGDKARAWAWAWARAAVRAFVSRNGMEWNGWLNGRSAGS